MKIAIRFQGLPPSDAVHWFAEREAASHLSRFGQNVESIEVRLRDVNGPRGGDDMECKVVAKGPRLGFSTITEVSGDMYQSVATAMARLARAVARSLERTRSLHPAAHHLS